MPNTSESTHTINTLAAQIVDFQRRCAHHPPSTDVVASRHGVARGVITEAGNALLAITGPSREQSLMLTHLEEALFWANADIARNQRGAESTE